MDWTCVRFTVFLYNVCFLIRTRVAEYTRVRHVWGDRSNLPTARVHIPWTCGHLSVGYTHCLPFFLKKKRKTIHDHAFSWLDMVTKREWPKHVAGIHCIYDIRHSYTFIHICCFRYHRYFLSFILSFLVLFTVFFFASFVSFSFHLPHAVFFRNFTCGGIFVIQVLIVR